MKKLFFVGILLFTALGFTQENGSITGQILDMESGAEPLLFADIALKDTSWRTQTNLNGNFEIMDVTPGNYFLSIGFLGYETREIPVRIEENKITRIEEGLKAKSVPGPYPESKGIAQTQKTTSHGLSVGLRD